ncbi:MAG: tRNA 5-methoxyuridine(34)/uridine 5-oxyacetic acid(34) synthase CmoB [Pseudomonadota bacterium]
MTERLALSPAGIGAALSASAFAAEAEALSEAVDPQVFNHGDRDTWAAALQAMPQIEQATPLLETLVVGVDGSAPEAKLRAALMALAPWRKGPLRFGPVTIDTEWRSDWKWERIAAVLPPLKNARVLDVGGGNGYFSYRLAGAGAASVLNVDPTLLFYAQFLALANALQDPRVAMLPAPFEALPELLPFDLVLSMGVLYHRRSPLEHLRDLYARLRPGGQLILETLVVEGDANTVLVPPGRYARMRNVWFLPSVTALERWLGRLGFGAIRTVDVTATSTGEQRSTDWMPFESLREALDPKQPDLTLEGHPAPLRAVITAERLA